VNSAGGSGIFDANRAAEVIAHLRALFAKKEPAADAFDVN
jgi:hypothetical protein